MADLTVALAGNPNAGKSTIFNALTGLRQHTGNWPGKTVEKKTGLRTYQGTSIEFVDLPGAYSLAAYSPDEIIARDFIVAEHPDVIICVVDSTNLERNLYLVVQLLELGATVVIALNMADQAQTLGIDVDYHHLSDLLGGVPIIPTVASRGTGIDRLLETTIQHVHSEKLRATASRENDLASRCQCQSPAMFQVDYDREIETAIAQLTAAMEEGNLALNGACSRWLSLKLLEGEQGIANRVASLPGGDRIIESARAKNLQLTSFFGDDLDIITADHRYGTVSGISRQVVNHSNSGDPSVTERIDRIVTNRIIGLPIFFTVMYVVFRLVIDVSAPYLNWVDGVINGLIASGLSTLLVKFGATAWIHSLVIDGIVAGVGGVMTFVPGLVALFFFLALLEDSGYMARAAFVMDRFMQFIGLHGKSVIPLMLGFGCAVPAIYATRTLSSRRDRLLTALLVPFMSCSARLPVYVVFTLAFFGNRAGTVIWMMYVLGVLVAVLLGFIFSRTVLKPDEKTAFVLELPPYRRPTLKSLSIHTWENTSEFIHKAGTVILGISMILWLLLHLPWGVATQEESYYGQASAAIAPALEPAGFGNYETSGALLTGLIAKELVVSTLSQIYTEDNTNDDVTPATLGEEFAGAITGFGKATVDAGRSLVSILPGVNLIGDDDKIEDTSLSQALQVNFSPLSGIAFLVFVLLYIPCIATMGAIKQEFGLGWASTAAVYQTTIAWLAAVLVFQGGQMLGYG